jgi:hypothetical protein
LRSNGAWANKELVLPEGLKPTPQIRVDVDFQVSPRAGALRECTVIFNTDSPTTFLWLPLAVDHQETAPDGVWLSEMNAVMHDKLGNSADFPFERLRSMLVRCVSHSGETCEVLVRRITLTCPDDR